MALKIKKKKNIGKRLAVITILGIQGGKVENEQAMISDIDNKANYYFTGQEAKKYFNTLPLLVEKYASKYKIIPIYTKEAKIFNEEVFNQAYESLKNKFYFDDNHKIDDERDINQIFQLYNKTLEEFDEVIVDVTHGFRHLPLLMIVELIMQNFKSIEKIKHIYFAKEIEKFKLYEIVDLKEYLDIANISFILTNFGKNFTVANHIQSKKYENLIKSLNEFSNDMMALNLNNLFTKSSKNLINELENIDDVSIKSQSQKLIEEIEEITDYKDKKRYKTYFDLANHLVEKNYILLSISLLYESVRLYIKTTIKQSSKDIVEKIEKSLNDDLYKIGDFFIKFKDDYTFQKLQNSRDYKDIITQQEFIQIKNAFPKKVLNNYKFEVNNNRDKSLLDTIAHSRNDLAHANSQKSFKDIKKNIKEVLNKYKEICIEQ